MSSRGCVTPSNVSLFGSREFSSSNLRTAASNLSLLGFSTFVIRISAFFRISEFGFRHSDFFRALLQKCGLEARVIGEYDEINSQRSPLPRRTSAPIVRFRAPAFSERPRLLCHAARGIRRREQHRKP